MNEHVELNGESTRTPSGVPPLVSVVVPTRDEAVDIKSCLDAVLAQNWPVEALEVIVVDGSSADGTADIARAHLAGCGLSRVEVIDNPIASTPSNLNIGLAAAKGDFVCRVDARSLIPLGYVRRCVEVLTSQPDVSVVGGRQVAVAPDETVTGRGIARALNNRYTMGMSRYRSGASSGPSDTVYLGFFRAVDLRAVDGWDERLGTNQDFDLNRRLSTHGTVWFDASLEVGYIPRSTLGALFRQYRRFGEAKVVYWRMTGDRPRPRQRVALAALPVTVLTGAGLVAAAPRGTRLRAAGIGALFAATGALAIERLGAEDDHGLPVRLTSLAASAAVTGGWSYGVWKGVVTRWDHPSRR